MSYRGRAMKLTSKNIVLPVLGLFLVFDAASAPAPERPTDGTIRFWVEDAIGQDPRTDTSAIDVNVMDGIVTLSGSVRSLAAKKYAEKEAMKIVGVLGVINKITVMPASRFDWDIAQDVRHRIVNDAAISSQQIAVNCTDGKVKLTGTVASWSDKEEADLVASEVRGVKDVENLLAVRWESKRSDDSIRQDAEDTLNRDVYLTELPINVSVKDGVVTLSGTVGSLYEKNRAAADVRWIDNVAEVKNDLKVQLREDQGARTGAVFPDNGQLRNYVTDQLFADTRLDIRDLSVKASYGHVTLNGSVPTYAQKKIAGEDARNVVGVAWVTNDLTVKSIRRSDDAIRRDILSDFSSDETLWNQNLVVSVHDGIVTLSGTVDSPYDKEHADAVASRTRGVREVNDNIVVNWGQEYRDLEVYTRVVNRIASDWLLAPVKDKISVAVQDGVVTLTGTVETFRQRQEAEQVAFNTTGVRLVDNQLKVQGYDYPWENWYGPVGKEGSQ
jgi:osmotically-inducible protein OsmY